MRSCETVYSCKSSCPLLQNLLQSYFGTYSYLLAGWVKNESHGTPINQSEWCEFTILYLCEYNFVVRQCYNVLQSSSSGGLEARIKITFDLWLSNSFLSLRHFCGSFFALIFYFYEHSGRRQNIILEIQLASTGLRKSILYLWLLCYLFSWHHYIYLNYWSIRATYLKF